jgi:ribosomal protein L11 methyltransferase
VVSLHLTCRTGDVEAISFALWEAGTAGIREEEFGDTVTLIAGFEEHDNREALTAELARFDPRWKFEQDTDWVAATQESWPARQVGQRIFLAPVWDQRATPGGRLRVIHNPGLASGTGEHPCTQLALESLERCVATGTLLVDVGTGSGILAVAALRMGARLAVAIDLDFPSLGTARENFELNDFRFTGAAGTADCIASERADVVVANISGTVLLAISDELLRIVQPNGWLILTGFPESELASLQAIFGEGAISEMNEWRCLELRL